MTEDEREYNRIIADCTETLDASPDDVIALIKRGWAWYDKGNYDDAIADFDNALNGSADRDRILNGRGLAFCDLGEHDLAITDFTEAILLRSTDKGLPALYFNRGRCRRFKGDHPAAIEDLTEAIRLAPEHADAYGVRGLAWQDIGDYGRAIEDYNLAICHDPDSADAFHNRGNAWVILGKYRKGIADLTRTIQLDPNSAVSYNSRGVAWRRKGRYAEALADYEQALKLDPQSAKRRLYLGAFLACCPHRRYRDGPRAVQLLTESCELTKYSDAYCIDGLAAAHAEQGDFPSAIGCEKQALSLVTDDDDRDYMRDHLALYKAGEPWRIESPTWRQRWA